MVGGLWPCVQQFNLEAIKLNPTPQMARIIAVGGDPAAAAEPVTSDERGESGNAVSRRVDKRECVLNGKRKSCSRDRERQQQREREREGKENYVM